MKTKNGRRRLRNSILYRLRGIIIPLSFLYRKYIIRHVKIIAVIGSFGKTTTTRAAATALGLSPEKYQGDNNYVFLSAGLLRIPPWARFRVQEVGICEKGQMQRNASLVRPNIVIVTSIGSEHNSSLGGLSQTRDEKAFMVRALPENGLAILNGDDLHVRKMKDYTKAKVITYGYGPSNDLQANYIKTDLSKGTHFSFEYGNQYHEISTKLLGKASIYSLMAAFIVAKELGLDLELVKKRLSELKPMRLRLELVNTKTGIKLLVDTFKSAIETVEHAMETFEALPAQRKIIILGEVEEPPESLGKIYREIGSRISKIASHMIFIGAKRVKRPLFSAAKNSGMHEDNLIFAERSITKAIEEALELIKPGDLVLIKGRSSQKLDRIAIALLGELVTCNLETCSKKLRCNSCIKINDGSPGLIIEKKAANSKKKLFDNKGKDVETIDGWFT